MNKFLLFVFRFDLVPDSFNYAHLTECLQHDNIMKTVLLSQILYSSLYTIQEMKSRRMRWVVHVALRVERGGACRVWCGKLRPGHKWQYYITIDI
jgi:hypothetical protein